MKRKPRLTRKQRSKQQRYEHTMRIVLGADWREWQTGAGHEPTVVTHLGEEMKMASKEGA